MVNRTKTTKENRKMGNISLFIGRFNPVHIGHLNTIKFLSEETKKSHGTAYIGLTNTSDNDSNPLNFKQKVKYMKLATERFNNVKVCETPVFTIYEFIRDMCFECQKSGGGTVTFYAGSDRVPSYKNLCANLLKKYQGRGELEDVELKVVEAMERGSFESYSATKMRQHVKDDDLVQFIDHCPFGSEENNEKYGTEMFNDIKSVYSGGNAKKKVDHNITSAEDTYQTVKDMSSKIKEHVNEITGKPDRLYVVGGAVRDQVLGKDVNDFDLITTMDYKKFADMFNADDVRFRGKNIIVVPVINGEPFETACLPRSMTLNDRLLASDLTMNAMAKDVETGEIIDPCGGQQDIQRQVINLTDFMKEAMPQGKQPVAVWRCIRFTSIFGWKMTDDTKQTLIQFAKKTRGKLKISEGQFMKDWNKIVKKGAEKRAIQLLKEIGLYDDVNRQFISNLAKESTIRWIKLGKTA